MNPHDLVVLALRGESAPWPVGAMGTLEATVLDVAADHGVMALLAAAPATESWPDRVRSALRDGLRLEAVTEAIRRQGLSRLLTQLSEAGIRSLLLKGAQLAYTHYPRPWLRPRLDTDLLIAVDDRTRADALLRGVGYRPRTHFDGDLVTHQFQYERPSRYGVTDLLDLHWKVANPQVFAGAFTFEELERAATPITRLGADARGLSDPHALVLACLHRVAHHDNSDRLIWLYDIHLLAGAMSPERREEIAAIAEEKRMRSVCAHGLTAAHARFATALPHGWLDRLRATGSRGEPSEAFLRSGRTKVDDLRSDLRVLSEWRPRVRLIREHLFPPVAYIRHAYRVSHPVLVCLAYAHRIVAGMRKWFGR